MSVMTLIMVMVLILMVKVMTHKSSILLKTTNLEKKSQKNGSIVFEAKISNPS